MREAFNNSLRSDSTEVITYMMHGCKYNFKLLWTETVYCCSR